METVNAKELRVGNLLLDGNDIEEVNYRMIKMLVEKEAEFDPIPLTEEWLFKFGFQKNQECYERPELLIPYHKTRFNGEMILVPNKKYAVELKHVHQLQNLYFALTGEELTIQNS